MKVREEAYVLSQGWEDLASVYGPPTDFLLVGGLGSFEIAAADPGHEPTEAGAGFLNGVFFAFFKEGVVALHSGTTFPNPLFGKGPIFNFAQDGFHRFFSASIHHPRAAGDVAVLGGFGNGEAHAGDTGLVNEVDDQLQFMENLKVGDFRLIACFQKNFESGLDEGGGASAENRLFTEQVGLGLFLESGLEQSGASGPDATGPSHGDGAGLAGGILLDGEEGGNAAAFEVLPAHDVAGTFGGNKDDIDSFGRENGFVVNIKAVAEEEALAFA